MSTSPCTHRVSTATRGLGDIGSRIIDPTRCIDCGTLVGGRELRPAWEHGLTRGNPDLFPKDWGYGNASSWMFSEFSPYGTTGHLEHTLRTGGKPGLLTGGDVWLDAAIAANLVRIGDLVALVKRMGEAAPAPLAPGDWDLLPTTCHEMRLTYVLVLGWCALQLVNAIRLRGGDYEGIVRPTRQRETPFSGLRHALTAAWTEQTRLGPSSKEPAGVEATHGLPHGIVFGTIAVSPSRSGSGHAQGEDHLLSRLAVLEAMEGARVCQRHSLDKEGLLVTIDSGAGHLLPVHLELLRLCLVGRDNRVATHDKHGIVPAIEELSVRDAVADLRRRRFPGAPDTEHEARLLLRRAKEAVTDQLFVCGLIPPPQERSRRGAERQPAINPFAAPGGR